jgi:hypothetical protein
LRRRSGGSRDGEELIDVELKTDVETFEGLDGLEGRKVGEVGNGRVDETWESQSLKVREGTELVWQSVKEVVVNQQVAQRGVGQDGEWELGEAVEVEGQCLEVCEGRCLWDLSEVVGREEEVLEVCET